MKSDLTTRLFTGIIFLIVMVAGILISQLSLLILFGIVVFLASQEFAKISAIGNPWVYALLSLGFFLTIQLYRDISPGLLIIGTLGYLVYAIVYKKKIYGISMTLLGALLIPVAFALLSSPAIANDDRLGILFFFLLLWTNDTMAYVTGRTIGRNKLWERISPKKTWEGFFGGVLFATILAFFTHNYFGFQLKESLIMALIIGSFGTLGDLMESSLKRKSGVKDSGSILPGHGGVLDRFDGVMLSSPMVFLYLSL